MRERPIIFSGPMVRAVVAGTKTQMRRAMRHQPERVLAPGVGPVLAIQKLRGGGRWLWPSARAEVLAQCPFGQPGDLLWVREAWAAPHAYDHLPPRLIPRDARIHYAATEDRGGLLSRPSIHMPRWGSRITLEITNVRVERLQDISEDDAAAEGARFELRDIDSVRLGAVASHRAGFERLWQSIHGINSWHVNPFVWVVEFRRIEQ